MAALSNFRYSLTYLFNAAYIPLDFDISKSDKFVFICPLKRDIMVIRNLDVMINLCQNSINLTELRKLVLKPPVISPKLICCHPTAEVFYIVGGEDRKSVFKYDYSGNLMGVRYSQAYIAHFKINKSGSIYAVLLYSTLPDVTYKLCIMREATGASDSFVPLPCKEVKDLIVDDRAGRVSVLIRNDSMWFVKVYDLTGVPVATFGETELGEKVTFGLSPYQRIVAKTSNQGSKKQEIIYFSATGELQSRKQDIVTHGPRTHPHKISFFTSGSFVSSYNDRVVYYKLSLSEKEFKIYDAIRRPKSVYQKPLITVADIVIWNSR